MQQLFIIVSCCLLFTACKSVPQMTDTNTPKPNSQIHTTKPIPPPETGLCDHRWGLTSLNGKTVKNENYPHGIPTLEISSIKNYASGFSGCNIYGGDCQFDESSIKFGQLLATERYCKDIAEPEFYYAMGLVNRYLITGYELRLYVDENLLLTFIASPASPSLILE